VRDPRLRGGPASADALANPDRTRFVSIPVLKQTVELTDTLDDAIALAQLVEPSLAPAPEVIQGDVV
jgi:hypothetical protein